MTAKGTRQGTLMLYHFDSYPHHAIGQVTFLWKPKLNDDDHPGDSVLWICCHPSFHTEALREIESCFKSISSNIGHLVTGGETEIQQKDQFSKISVLSLKDQLVKFRLYGTASNKVLSETLQIADLNVEKDICGSDKENTVTGAALVSAQEMSCIERIDEQTEPWWKKFYSRNYHLQTFKQQADVWLQLAHCQSPAEAPANCILGLCVRDPRVLLPPKKSKVSVFSGMGSGYQTLSSELFTADIGNSPLWEPEIREEVKTTKILEQKLNDIKSKQLVPGTPLQLGDNESRIPVILIQRPGTNFNSLSPESGYASGWDVLIPSGWAMAFWVALVYRGARVGGIRESRSIAQHAGLLSPAFDFPDTVSGTDEMKSESTALQARHDSRPPAKRPNYTKLGFPSPFAFQFGKLVKEWMGKWVDSKHDLQESYLGLTEMQIPLTNNSFSVLRDKKMLKLLDCALNGKQFLSSKARNSSRSEDTLAQIVSCDLGQEMMEKHASAIVAVVLKFPLRGVPAMFGHICQPSEEDLKEINRDKNFGGPFEMKHKDPEEGKRKEERKERLRRRRRKSRGKKEFVSESGDNQETEKLENPDEVMEKVSDSMKEETKPSLEDSSSVKLLSHTSRPIIGFVRHGDFDLVRGQGSGIGFCSVAALLLLLAEKSKHKNTVVLVRNPTSQQYRFSSMSIII